VQDAGERGQRLGVQGVDDVLVADVAGVDGFLLAGLDGQRRGVGVVPAGQPASSQFNQSLQKGYTYFFFFGGPCWWGEYVVVGDTVVVPVTAGDVAVGGLDD
jgi:hypothetical protein